MKPFRLAFALLLASVAFDHSSFAAEQRVLVAEGGKTEFQIVLPAEPTEVDRYAAAQLAFYLELSTGAKFPLIESKAHNAGGGPAIFLGWNEDGSPAKSAGREYAAVSDHGNIYLSGAGMHGNLYAVVDFLEHAIKWRWFSIFEAPVFEKRDPLVLAPFRRRHTPSFAACRVDFQRSMDFPYLHGANLGFSPSVARFAARGVDVSGLRQFVSAEREVTQGIGGGHSLFSFVPPDVTAVGADSFPWLRKKDYFKTNPEFFSMNANGVRVPNLQLNFGNPELRKELTQNVLELIKREGEDIVVDIGAMDVPGRFCHSPESSALEDKYQTPAGPLVDYLIELCGVLREKHPEVRVKTNAYRRAQTQKPPVLSKGQKLPANLIVEFAPVEDNYFADWTSKDPLIQETVAHFKGWAALTAEGNLRAWIYPNPYGSGYGMPVGNISRTVRNIKLLHQWGARGITVDLIGIQQRSGFAELHYYLSLRLAMDVEGDVDAWIQEFTDSMYGSSAPGFRKYLDELNRERERLDPLPSRATIASRDLNEETFPYLTPENVHRWQGYFAEMEKVLPEKERAARINVRLARRELDFATLWKWFDLQKAYPHAYRDHAAVVARIREANSSSPEPLPAWFAYDVNRAWKIRPVRTGLLEDLNVAILAGRNVKPYPKELQGIPPGRIHAFLPSRTGGQDEDSFFELDADASTGLALVVDAATLPHRVQHWGGTNVSNLATLDRAGLVPGQYQLHDLGEMTIGESSAIALSPSGNSRLEIGQRLYEPGAENRWKAYISMKFDGPLYGGAGEKNRLLVDRIYLVQLGLDQFDPARQKRE